MIDSHCHIECRNFDKDRKEIVEAAKKAGVTRIINPASDFASNERVQKVAEKFKGYILPCAGIDPISFLAEYGRFSELEGYLDNAVAVGEVGLDYYWSKEKQQQMHNFKKFIDLAMEHDKPIIVHAREAMGDALKMLEEKRAEKVILHCFSGTKANAKHAIDMGFYISFATNICYRSSKSLIKDVALSNMLIETDSPYLHPLRQGRNEPRNVGAAADYIAAAIGASSNEIKKITEKNTKRAFGL